jgi:antitoxin (DNA-binding transcriptional repressor) of toxin-antitoxin stability system
MNSTINAKTLRASLPEIVDRIRKGQKFTVIYRSRPAFRLVPVDEDQSMEDLPLEDDPIYRADTLGRSEGASGSLHHDEILYGCRVTPSTKKGP